MKKFKVLNRLSTVLSGPTYKFKGGDYTFDCYGGLYITKDFAEKNPDIIESFAKKGLDVSMNEKYYNKKYNAYCTFEIEYKLDFWVDSDGECGPDSDPFDFQIEGKPLSFYLNSKNCKIFESSVNLEDDYDFFMEIDNGGGEIDDYPSCTLESSQCHIILK